jgi:hypothetical protein
MQSVVAAVVCALVGATQPAPPGVVIEQKTVHAIRSIVGMVEQEDAVRLSLAPAGTRVESVGSGSPIIFRREADGNVTRLEANGFKKTYRVESLAARAEVNAGLRDSLTSRPPSDPHAGGGLLGALGGLSAERAAAGASGQPVSVTPIAAGRTIAGQPCRGFTFHQDGEKVFEAWYTVKPAPAWMVRFDLDESPGASNAPLMAARRAEKGVELESSMPLTAGGRYEVKTTSYRETAVPSSAFQPPAGYRLDAPPAATR